MLHLRHTDRDTKKSHVTWHLIWGNPMDFVEKLIGNYREAGKKDGTSIQVDIISEKEYQKEKGYKKTV